MTDTLQRMIAGFEQSKEGGGYFLLYLLALLLGAYLLTEQKKPVREEEKSEKTRKSGGNEESSINKEERYPLWPFAYGAWILALVVANPVTLYLLGRIFPALSDLSLLWGVLPVSLLIAYGAVCFLGRCGKNGEKKEIPAFWIGAVLLIGLAGSGYGLISAAGGGQATDWEIQGEIQSALSAVKRAERPIYLVAPEEVLEYARAQEPSLYLLYGKDLYTPNMDLGIMDGYDPELTGLYEAMKNPEECMEDIAAMSGLYDCSAIIIDAYEGAPTTVGMYEQVKDTGRYLVYIQQSGETK